MLTMRVLGLTLDETSHAPILLLQEEAGRELLPIWIGPLEAMAISVVLGKMAMERPLTHDLCINVLHSLKARLSGVELVDVRDGTYYADLLLLRENGETYRLDCRPSDAVALALRAQAPIRAKKTLLRRAAALQAPAEATCGSAFVPAPADQPTLQSHADKDVSGHAGQGLEQDRLVELLRSLEPESKRKM